MAADEQKLGVSFTERSKSGRAGPFGYERSSSSALSGETRDGPPDAAHGTRADSSCWVPALALLGRWRRRLLARATVARRRRRRLAVGGGRLAVARGGLAVVRGRLAVARRRRRVRAEKRLEILRCTVGGHTIAIGMTSSSSSSSSSSSFFLTFSLGSRARLAAQAERKAEKRQKFENTEKKLRV